MVDGFNLAATPLRPDADASVGSRPSLLSWLRRVGLPFCLTFIFSIGNVVMQKVMAESWTNLTSFCLIMTVMAYVVVYGVCLCFCVWRGHATYDMLQFIVRQCHRRRADVSCNRKPVWLCLLLAAVSDAVQSFLTLMSASKISGAFYLLAHYVTLLSVVLSSSVIARTTYSSLHVVGVGVVFIGAVIAVVPAFQNHAERTDSLFAGLAILAFIIYGVGYGFREVVFTSFKNSHENRSCRDIVSASAGRDLNIFVVKFPLAVLQMLVLPFLVVSSPDVQAAGENLPEYFKSGFMCLRNRVPDNMHSPGPNQCKYAWELYTTYIIFNLLTNICMTWLLSSGGPVLLFIALYGALPVCSFVFTMDLPLLPGAPLPHLTIATLCIMMLGTGIYAAGMLLFPGKPCCWPFGRRNI